jgi:hypothetical protein
MPSDGIETPLPASLFARLAAAARYAITGVTPDTWFGPQQPLTPQAPPEVKGRQWDYPFGVNLSYVPRSEAGISFLELRALADALPLLRAVIETRKDQIAGLNWSVRARDPFGSPNAGARIAAARGFLARPDRRHDFATWLRILVEDMLVIDAATIYPRFALDGSLYSLDVIDGSTITPLIGEDGRSPEPPDPAYQQVLHGVPAADFAFDDLLYLPRNVRSHRLYGMSPVEQIALTINIALRRDTATLDYYRMGSVPDSFATLPKDWTTDQLRQFQDYFDSLMSGNLERRRMVKFMPADFKLMETRQPPLKDQYDEWLARVICYAFSVPASAFVSQVNRATSETLRMQATQEGLAPLKSWVKNALDCVIQVHLKQPDLEFVWVGDDGVDPLEQAQTLQILVGAGIKTREEARADLGLAAESGKGAPGLGKFNPYHDEQGRFTGATGAVDTRGDVNRAPRSESIQVAALDNFAADASVAGGDSNAVAAGPTMPMMEEPAPEPVKPTEPSPAAPDSANPSTNPSTSGSGRAAALVDPTLLDRIIASGVKVTPENVVATGVMPDGRMVWLETGDKDSGLAHIIGDHGLEFTKIGVADADIPQVIINALTNGTIVGYQGQGNDRPIIETEINGEQYKIAITVGSNGYIVGANMRGRSR